MPTAKQVMAPLEALAGENEAILGSNNTTVNKFFNAPGAPYCGYSVWYGIKKSGSPILKDCANPAYVPTIKSFMEAKGWRISNERAAAGDIFVKQAGHVGFVHDSFLGTTIITLEGNSTVYDNEAKARAASIGSGAYEGIGYKKLTLDDRYTVYRPPYDMENPVPSVDIVYTVEAGDTLFGIALRFGVTVDMLTKYNGIADPDLIMVDQHIRIPVVKNLYTVAPGDTLWSIARRCTVPVATLVAINGITDPDLINVGQVLQLPNNCVEE